MMPQPVPPAGSGGGRAGEPWTGAAPPPAGHPLRLHATAQGGPRPRMRVTVRLGGHACPARPRDTKEWFPAVPKMAKRHLVVGVCPVRRHGRRCRSLHDRLGELRDAGKAQHAQASCALRRRRPCRRDHAAPRTAPRIIIGATRSNCSGACTPFPRAETGGAWPDRSTGRARRRNLASRFDND